MARAIYTRLWRAQNGLCSICGNIIATIPKNNRRHKVTLDHVWPRRYGFPTKGGVLLAHGKCNFRKADRDPTGCEIILLHVVNAAMDAKPPIG